MFITQLTFPLSHRSTFLTPPIRVNTMGCLSLWLRLRASRSGERQPKGTKVGAVFFIWVRQHDPI